MKKEEVREYIVANKLNAIKGRRPAKETWRNYERKYLYYYLRFYGMTLTGIADMFDLEGHASVQVGLKTYENLKNQKDFVFFTEKIKKLFPVVEERCINPEKEVDCLIEMENLILKK